MSAELCGLGVEIVSVPRFRRALDRSGARLLDRVFLPAEIEYTRRKRNGWQNLAARFAAKCAGRRAFASVCSRPIRLRDLEVVRRRSGEPTLALRGPAAPEAAELRVSLSLTHDRDFALASVWVERSA